MKKNILYISTTANLNKYGAERRLIDLLRHLDRSVYNPIVLVPFEGPFSEKIEEIGVEVIVLDFIFRIRKVNPFYYFRFAKDVYQILRNKDIHLVHFNLHYYISNFWIPIKICGIPIVVHYRNCGWVDRVEKYLMTFCEKIIFVSKAAKNAFTKPRRSDIFLKVKSNKMVVLYDGIEFDNSKLNGNNIRNEYRIPEWKKIVALIGALDPIKGQRTLIEAAKCLSKKRGDVIYLLVGDTYFDKDTKRSYVAELKDLVRYYGLEDSVYFTGYRDDVLNINKSIDLLVQPSEQEALGTSLIEAMSVKKPVIGTYVGGIPEVIGSQREAGLLVNSSEAEGLSDAMDFVLSNSERAREMGEAGYARVEKMFDVEKNIKKLESIYKDILEGSRLNG